MKRSFKLSFSHVFGHSAGKLVGLVVVEGRAKYLCTPSHLLLVSPPKTTTAAAFVWNVK